MIQRPNGDDDDGDCKIGFEKIDSKKKFKWSDDILEKSRNLNDYFPGLEKSCKSLKMF